MILVYSVSESLGKRLCSQGKSEDDTTDKIKARNTLAAISIFPRV